MWLVLMLESLLTLIAQPHGTMKVVVYLVILQFQGSVPCDGLLRLRERSLYHANCCISSQMNAGVGRLAVLEEHYQML